MAHSTCTGSLVNPLSDICWKCFFPMTIGNMEVFSGGAADTPNFSSPVCICPKGGIPTPGIAFGLWEPIALIDVTKEPFCFVNLGGVQMGAGLSNLGNGSQPSTADDQNKNAFHHVHYYKYPISLLLNLAIDAGCLEATSFDVAYMSEVDPLWKDDELALIVNPEAMAFSNVIAQSSCAADCAKASIGLPFDSLFWCAGCHGSMYPLTGRGTFMNIIQNTVLMAEKVIFKMHRNLMLHNTSGPESICGPKIAPVIKKNQYRTQIINPVPATSAALGCQPLGRTTAIYESGRTIPVKGEHYGYLLWRKRNCCVL